MKHTLKRVLAMGTALVLTLGLSTAALEMCIRDRPGGARSRPWHGAWRG